MEQRYNTRSPAVKRLMKEAQELSEPTDQYFAQPLDDNLFEWHFTVRGPADSDFQNGIYHGRIILPVDYPMKPPSIIWLTPNGRFETNKKICLSISGHHPESWQPSWSIRTALLAIIGFMPTRPGGAIGSLDYKPEERRVLAKRSREWKCPSCGDVRTILLEPAQGASSTAQEAKNLAAQINFQGEKPKCTEESTTKTTPPTSDAPPPASQAPPPASQAPPPTSQAPSPPQSSMAQEPANPASPVLATAPGAPTSPPVHPPLPPAFLPWGVPNLPQTPPFTTSPPPSVHLLPRFPFPPSHYPAGYAPHPFYPMPYMFPPGGPLPPNNTPSQRPASNQSYTRSPMTVRQNTQPPPPRPTEPSVQVPISQADSQAKTTVMAELLQNVKRVGSDSRSEAPTQDEGGASEGATAMVEKSKTEEAKPPETNSEVSQSLKKTSQATDFSNRTDLEVDESSERDAPPISENDQRSGLEKSISGSTSDLERRRGTSPKSGLRQRQSAMARIQQDSEGEAPSGSERSGQRIEAASGDTRTGRQERLNLAANRLAARQREVLTEMRNRNSEYDFSFILMVVVSLGAVLILLNRLRIHVDWEALFEDTFRP